MDEMQAGREMDALIAEKVMGWRFWQEPFKNSEKLGWASASPYGQEFFHDEKTGFLPYSTDIASAWDVVEQKRFMGSVKVEWSKGNRWHCGFASLGGGYFEAWADTAPLAICRAALKAVGE